MPHNASLLAGCCDLKLFKEIKLIFPVAGHTRNWLDKHHAHPAKSFHYHEANNLCDLKHLLKPNGNYRADWMVCFHNWDEFFSSLAEFPQISVPHMFSVKMDGICSKLDANDERGSHSGKPQLNVPVDLFSCAQLPLGNPKHILPAPPD